MLTQEEKSVHVLALGFCALFNRTANGILAGGCARDILLDKAPKDYDLWVLSDISVNETLENLKTLHRDAVAAGVDSKISVNAVFHNEYQGAPERRDIEFVLKVVFCDINIDIIKMKRPEGEAVSALDVLDGFDFPMNKFAYTLDGNVVGNGHFYKVQYANRVLGENRLAYMQERFPDYTFIDLN